jgi:hypothetical protein
VSQPDLPRKLKAQIESLGFTVLETRRCKHYAVKLRSPSGGIRTFTFCVSPSDYRSRLNEFARLKRFEKGGTNGMD